MSCDARATRKAMPNAEPTENRHVTKRIKPDVLWPAGREGAVHEAISSLWTGCGRMLGADWYETEKAVDCKSCLRKTYTVKAEV